MSAAAGTRRPRRGRLVNPMAPAVSTAAPAAAVSTAAAVATAAPAAAAVPDAAAAPVATPPAGEPAAQGQAPAAAGGGSPAVSSSTYIALKRDPMLSPFDHVRMMEEAEAKEKARRDLEEAKNRRSRVVVRKEPPPETLVELQGIIANAEGESKAIVSDQIVGVGETVNKMRVVRITSQGVTFEYKGKRFTKSVNRE